ncbi:hypothetical protein A2V71_01300 [Candidatus Berkelbacteria bacterium RBG_13_40_8]|uniref:histidine kinase n=1 Tax=Candidatus Berkelbacteria bacterium RBG_13_40_8 TaxID=1797467 RepID=A0A1F5DME3_9BACT|nr:MAG: hypothetical protein A2V71_01300 [Candidatus Berkelbacteria bacterium RBG_13_40_8]
MDIEKPKHYESIVDIAPIGILSYGYDENILIVNQQMAFYLSKSPKELTGKNVKVTLSELNPEILILIDAVKNRASVFEEFFPIKLADQELYFNIKGVVLPEQGLLIFENVTGIKEYQDELKNLDRSKDEFISIASHDLRTPISAIRGYLDMVLKEEVGVISTPKMKEYLELSRQGALRLNDLVEDMLSVSRIDQKRMKFKLEEISLESPIESIISELTPQANAKKLFLRYEKPKTLLPTAQIDKNRFLEVLGNLITNAIKFTQQGGVTLKTLPREDHIRIDCVDTGIGILHGKQKDIFKKFIQLDSSTSSQQKGTGLGLYICKTITEKMGGRIGITSAPNKGSDFFFTVPIAGTPLAKRAAEVIKKETLEHPLQK